MRVGVVGLGPAGGSLALLLARDGHEVTVLEREERPGPVGAGIWLHHLGQQVLARLGLLDRLRTLSRPVSRVEGLTLTGRPVLTFSYADLPGAVPALGVHRGALFGLLHEALAAAPVVVRTGVPVTGVRPGSGGAVVETADGALGPFDLVVGADGSRSTVRSALGVTRRDRPYRYGALWAVVDDPEHLAGDVLHQRFDGTRRYFGVLPTGNRQASIFWSVRADRADPDVGRWRVEARPFAGRYAPLVESVELLLPATYRDVVVRAPYAVNGASAAVVVGDAAHAMSPQLGAGTSLALADAWLLASALRRGPRVAEALTRYARARAAHVRYYQWVTRAMTPVFQSDLDLLAAPRDLLAAPVSRVPWLRRQMVATLVGDRTSPWGRVTLP